MFQVREYTSLDTPGINSCTEERSFWISWQNGAIEVGRGEILGQERFLDFQPLEFYPIRAVGFSTGYSFNGTWSIKLLDGKQGRQTAKYLWQDICPMTFVIISFYAFW